jgi:sugar lactone lactonase YvrE
VGAVRIGFVLAIAACTTSEPPASTLFVSDYRANAIVRYDGTTGELIDVFAQGLDQRVDRPAGVQRGPDGHIYAAGFGRGDVVRYDPATGAMMDVFYWDTRLLEEPVELAFRGDHLFVLGNDTKNLVELDPRGAVVRSFGDPIMRGAQDFVIDGDVAFVATESHPTLGTAIQEWDLATGTLGRAFGTYDELAFAAGLALHDGILYVSDFERGQVTRFDAATGVSLGVLVTDLSAPVDVDVGPDGTLHVLDALGLHRFDRALGKLLGTLVRVADGVLARPLGFTFVVE